MSQPTDGAAMAGLLAVAAQHAGKSGASYSSFKQQIRDGIRRDPMDAALTTLFGGAFLFYLAEREVNPKVGSYWDALVYISTCFSVGYSDIFAKTSSGKAIATAIMTFGPAMTAAILDPPGGEPDLSPKLLAVQEAIAEKLDAILGELRAERGN